MAKTFKYKSLGKNEEEALLLDFFRSLGTMHGFNESAEVFRDLLTRAELTMLAKRLKVAKLLLAGVGYREIMKQVKVSSSTIAKINLWLEEAGSGFRLMFERGRNIPISDKANTYSLKSSLKRRAPMNFWPEILLNDIVRMLDSKKRKQLYSVLKTMQRKGKLDKDLGRLILN